MSERCRARHCKAHCVEEKVRSPCIAPTRDRHRLASVTDPTGNLPIEAKTRMLRRKTERALNPSDNFAAVQRSWRSEPPGHNGPSNRSTGQLNELCSPLLLASSSRTKLSRWSFRSVVNVATLALLNSTNQGSTLQQQLNFRSQCHWTAEHTTQIGPKESPPKRYERADHPERQGSTTTTRERPWFNDGDRHRPIGLQQGNLQAQSELRSPGTPGNPRSPWRY